VPDYHPRFVLRSICSALLLLTVAGCGPRDPLEKIRQLQDVKQDFDGSLEPLRALMKERPDDPEIQYRYGSALIATVSPALRYGRCARRSSRRTGSRRRVCRSRSR